MERMTLKSILDASEGIEHDGNQDGCERYRLAQGLDATLLAEAGAASLTIARVRRLDLAEGHVAVETQRGERYFLQYGRIVAFKTESEPENALGARSGAGFRTAT